MYTDIHRPIWMQYIYIQNLFKSTLGNAFACKLYELEWIASLEYPTRMTLQYLHGSSRTSLVVKVIHLGGLSRSATTFYLWIRTGKWKTNGTRESNKDVVFKVLFLLLNNTIIISFILIYFYGYVYNYSF